MSCKCVRPCIISDPTICGEVAGFTHKVLQALHALQGAQLGEDGVSVANIEKYVRNKFCTDGDVTSQIKASLLRLEDYGIVLNTSGLYVLNYAAAAVQSLPPSSCQRFEEMKRVRQIFQLGGGCKCGFYVSSVKANECDPPKITKKKVKRVQIVEPKPCKKPKTDKRTECEPASDAFIKFLSEYKNDKQIPSLLDPESSGPDCGIPQIESCDSSGRYCKDDTAKKKT